MAIAFRPQSQRNMHDPANGRYGDCQRTCLAMVLGLEAEEVPHFADPTQFAEDDGCRKAERTWLAERGWAIIQLPISGDWGEGFLGRILEQQPDIPLIVSGQSPRGAWNHDVVMRSGVLHDPHPDRTGLAGPCIDLDRPDDPRWFWVTVLTPPFDGGRMMADFWSIAIGLLSVFALYGLIALYAEYTDRRDHARYRRRQQDRVKGGLFHGGEQ